MSKPTDMKKTKCKDCKTEDRAHGRSYCQQCFWERYGKKSGEKYNHYRRNYKDENRKFVHRYKEYCGCKVCGEDRYWVLDMHHLDPSQKEFDFYTGVSRKRQVLKDEMRKCIVLCKIHHYDFHHQEKHTNININDYIKKNKT
tara:strand:- start:27 stop:452 length:426 start_codon:yes stop_codon:yes gene_type:complete